MKRPSVLTVFIVVTLAGAIFVSFKRATKQTTSSAKPQVYEAKATWSR